MRPAQAQGGARKEGAGGGRAAPLAHGRPARFERLLVLLLVRGGAGLGVAVGPPPRDVALERLAVIVIRGVAPPPPQDLRGGNLAVPLCRVLFVVAIVRPLRSAAATGVTARTLQSTS